MVLKRGEWKATPFLSLTEASQLFRAGLTPIFHVRPPPCPVAKLPWARESHTGSPAADGISRIEVQPGWADISVEERAQARLPRRSKHRRRRRIRTAQPVDRKDDCDGAPDRESSAASTTLLIEFTRLGHR